jgi:hypothetical protein
VQQTAEGQEIHSRYYPVKSYAVCANDRPWAWCLDKPCTIDKNNPEAAACTCDLVKKSGSLRDRDKQIHSGDMHNWRHLVGDRCADRPGDRLAEKRQSISPIPDSSFEQIASESQV